MSFSEESVIYAIEKARIVPVVAIDHAEDAVALCGALKEGGLEVVEITFRTEAAAESIRAIIEAYPDFIVGAGTVTRLNELEQAFEAGASFAVAPGTNPVILAQANVYRLPFYPGVCTPSDIEIAMEHDMNSLKFYPAEASGGLKMLSALYGPYAHREIRFMPTGGISPKNLKAYLKHPAVSAVGGTWMVPKKLIEKQDWSAIEILTREAVAIADEASK
ncbi:MAG TPA: bifunctional 4-hydroxy-2-oxoglutarate aldolase/2-dehydro-3-deoxy-phosphogluconate aldolase [Candidatus Hydrogenedentes bacterium]|nr:bifunctional 4-hydroxy-2-oxoglutarate aldolase/2-dehydro-3-deoxy-phosphogluconate aldolase [Candidatus Hydrogenedentota bacterium]